MLHGAATEYPLPKLSKEKWLSLEMHAETIGVIFLSRHHFENDAQARIQLLAKGEVVKIMENIVLLPKAANISDRMPRKRVPQPAHMSFSGYRRTIDIECASWEPHV